MSAPGGEIGSQARPWREGDPIPGVNGAPHQPPPLGFPGGPQLVSAPLRGVAEDFDAFASIAAARKKTEMGPHEVMQGSALKMIEAGERILAADNGQYTEKALGLILAGNKLLKEMAPFVVAKKVEVQSTGSTQSHDERIAEIMQASANVDRRQAEDRARAAAADQCRR